MNVKEVFEEITFATSTVNDLSGRNINNLFSTKDINRQLKFALDEYAQYTKALEGVLSLPLDASTRIINAPSDVLRSMGYRYIYAWLGGRKYSLDIANFNKTQSEFPYQDQTGIPQWILPFGDKLYVYPLNSETYSTTTLTADIDATATTIPVASTNGFQDRNGRVSIGDERFEYLTKDATNFYGVTRGVENTTPTTHTNGDTLKENNVFIFYYKKHFDIKIFDDGKNSTIKKEFLYREMEVDSAHLLTIINRAAYLLLKKVDTTRANAFKMDWQQWLDQARIDIKRGRSSINNSGNIRPQYDWERGDFNYVF